MQSVDELVDLLQHNDEVMSRTVSTGRVDRAVDPLKLPLKVSGPKLLATVTANRVAVAQYIAASDVGVVGSAPDLVAALLTVGSLTLSGMLPSTLFRTWDLPEGRHYGPAEDSAAIPPSMIWLQLQRVAGEIAQQFGNDPLGAAARIEWEVGVGPLHPFYDACGRTSRAASALLQGLAGLQPKRFRSRDEYFEAATLGRAAFADYYRSL